MSSIGDRCSNAAWTEVWTCPSCYTDHHSRVINCSKCGVSLSCTIEDEPVPVCTIVDPADRNDP